MAGSIKNLWLVFGLCYCANAQSLNPTGSIGVHDPVMIKENDTYYIFHTGNNIPVKTSSNMVNWSNGGTAVPSAAWQQQAVPGNNGRNFWAPDISYRNGKYWLYYSISTFGSQTSAIGLVTKTSLSSGSWEDQGVVITSPASDGRYNAIDPNIIVDEQGDVWMNWGSWWDGIFIIQLDLESGKPLDNANPIRIAGRGGSGIEGSFIIRTRGYFYLFTSWDRCCDGTNSTYNMRVGRSENVTGPYEDKDDDLLLSGGGTLIDDGTQWAGGHNGIFEEDGNYFLVYHVYKSNSATLDIRHLYFDDEAWPTLDPDLSTPVTPFSKGKKNSLPITFQHPLTISLQRNSQLVLFELSGKKVLSRFVNSTEKAQFPEIKPGIYYLQLRSKESSVNQQIVVY